MTDSDLDRLLSLPEIRRDVAGEMILAGEKGDKLLMKELEKKLGRLYDDEDTLRSKLSAKLEKGESWIRFKQYFKQLEIKNKDLESKVKELTTWKEETLCVVDDMKKRVKALEEELSHYESKSYTKEYCIEAWDNYFKLKEAIEKIKKCEESFNDYSIGLKNIKRELKAILESIGAGK